MPAFWPQQGTALTPNTRFTMRRSRVIERKDKSSAAEGEALPGHRNQERNENQETGMPTQLSDEPPKKDRRLVRDKGYLFQKALLYPLVLEVFLKSKPRIKYCFSLRDLRVRPFLVPPRRDKDSAARPEGTAAHIKKLPGVKPGSFWMRHIGRRLIPYLRMSEDRKARGSRRGT